MRKCVLFLLSAGMLILVDVAGVRAENRPLPAEAGQAVQNGLNIMKKQKGWKNVAPGESFGVCKVSNKKLLNPDELSNLSALCEPTRLWLLPVVADNGEKAVLLLTNRENTWIPETEYGSISASIMISIAETWPRAEGYDYRIILAGSLSVRLIEVSHKGHVIGLLRLYPQEAPAYSGGSFAPPQLREPAGLAAEVRDIARKLANNLHSGR